MKKQEKGITLVALIITIIVLLILAVVSIQAVTGTGLFSKANKATDAYNNSKAKEDYMIDSYINAITNYGTGENYTNASSSSSGESSSSNSSSSPKTIDYLSKTKAEVISEAKVGDDITIGTEKFKVFYASGGVIKAMPYYNITITTSNPIQSSSAGKTQFSTGEYWTLGADEIDMTDSRNNIQQYITAYQGTLESKGATGISVSVPRYSELTAEGITNAMRNPSFVGVYWVGSSLPKKSDTLWVCFSRR